MRRKMTQATWRDRRDSVAALSAMSIGEVQPMEQPTLNENHQPTTRGGWLTAFLVFMIFSNAFAIFSVIAYPDAARQQYPPLTDLHILLLTAGLFFNLGLVVLIWRWRKVGVYGFFGVAAVAAIVVSQVRRFLLCWFERSGHSSRSLAAMNALELPSTPRAPLFSSSWMAFGPRGRRV